MKKETFHWRPRVITFYQLQDMSVSEADLTSGFPLSIIYGISGVRKKFLSGGFN